MNKGFVALISSIIISAILLIILTTLSLGEFYTRYNILDSELKERSRDIADACVDETLLAIANNSAYTGNETKTVNENTCFIDTVVTNGSEKSFRIRAIYQNYFTSLKIIIDSSTLNVLSWEEIRSF